MQQQNKNFYIFVEIVEMDKTIDIGGTSDIGDAAAFVEFAKIINPKTVLDVGTGCFGKTAYLLRQYVEHKFRHYFGTNYMLITGIEAYEPNLKYVSKFNLYDNLINAEALQILDSAIENTYDLIVCSHVIEHHIKSDGWKLLSLMNKKCRKGIILSAPYGEYEHIDNHNRYQNHLSSWTPEEISAIYPITTPVITRNNVGKEEFIIVIPKFE
jgi:2-polyprenyl-3-methyl-5-hydroxy-6-metoxy-1,4-benzoquinol methylase